MCCFWRLLEFKTVWDHAKRVKKSPRDFLSKKLAEFRVLGLLKVMIESLKLPRKAFKCHIRAAAPTNQSNFYSQS